MREDKRVLWLWLHAVLGPCTALLKPLLSEYDHIETIYERRETADLAARLGAAEYKRAREISLDDCARTLEHCQRENIAVLCYSDKDYPERLRATHFPPTLLFVTGDIAALNRPLAVAGVGARYCTQYGRDAVSHICVPLAKAGIALVSGLAHGIDAEVHRAALKNSGPTVAVMGTPIDHTYPAQHAGLRRDIEQGGGAVVSEYAPGYEYNRGLFPQRNRIISGLSRAVIIFEAARKSGTMITANWALDDGRDVFAVPGSIFAPQSEGTNLLLRQGAMPATSAVEVLEALDLRSSGYEQLMLEEAAPAPQLSTQQQKIYDVLERGECTVDVLSDCTGFAPHVLLAELTAMEIDGAVLARGGAKYAIRR